jgi:hypothetical protein
MAEKLMSKDVKAIAAVVNKAALEGDLTAAKLVLERLLPPPKSRGQIVQLPLPPIHTTADATAAMGSVIAAVAAGLLTIDEGGHLNSMISKYAERLEISELAERVEQLEPKLVNP